MSLFMPSMFLSGRSEFTPHSLAGFGTSVTGAGSSPTIIQVTNTNNSGAGSLRQAITDANNTGDREIRLMVGGIYALDSSLTINGSNITLTGRYADGPHAIVGKPTWNGFILNVTGSNVLVEHIRILQGTTSSGSQGRPVQALGSGGKAFRFCTFAFSTDQINVTTGDAITFQYCLFMWPLHRNMHTGGAHGFGQQNGFSGDGAATKKATYDKCVMALESERNAVRMANGCHTHVVNVISYGWGSHSSGGIMTDAGSRCNVFSSVHMSHATGGTARPWQASTSSTDDASIHISSDTIWQNPSFDQVTGSACHAGGANSKFSSSPVGMGDPSNGTVIPVGQLWDHLRPLVGAYLPARAWIDSLVLSHVASAWAKVGHASGAVIIDSVFRQNDPNTNSSADHTTAPLADYDDGAGWSEALSGP